MFSSSAPYLIPSSILANSFSSALPANFPELYMSSICILTELVTEALPPISPRINAKSAAVIKFLDPVIRKIQVSNSQASTFTVTVYEHDGSTYNALVPISLTAQRSKEEDFNIPVTSGKELAVQITAGSCKNPVVGVILDGLF